MSLAVGKGTRVMDIVRHVETQASQYAQVLSGSAFAGDMSLTLPDADKVMVIMRLLPDSVREYVQLHGSYGSFAEVRSAVDNAVRPEAESIWFWIASQCGASAAKHAKRIAGREAVSRVEATEGALRAEIEVIEVIEAVARIVGEGSLRVQVRRRSQRGVGTVVTRTT